MECGDEEDIPQDLRRLERRGQFLIDLAWPGEGRASCDPFLVDRMERSPVPLIEVAAPERGEGDTTLVADPRVAREILMLSSCAFADRGGGPLRRALGARKSRPTRVEVRRLHKRIFTPPNPAFAAMRGRLIGGLRERKTLERGEDFLALGSVASDIVFGVDASSFVAGAVAAIETGVATRRTVEELRAFVFARLSRPMPSTLAEAAMAELDGGGYPHISTNEIVFQVVGWYSAIAGLLQLALPCAIALALTSASPEAVETRGIVLETLRLFNPITTLGRTMARGVALRGGLRLSEGENLTFPFEAYMRSGECWRDPDLFRPERWRDGGDTACMGVFSIGPRSCPAWRAVLFVAERALEFLLSRDAYSLDPRSAPVLDAEGGVREVVDVAGLRFIAVRRRKTRRARKTVNRLRE